MPALHRILKIAVVLAMLLAQAVATAHELDHATGAHDAPCALHVFANDMPGTVGTPPALLLPSDADAPPRPHTSSFLPFRLTRPFSARAPPFPV